MHFVEINVARGIKKLREPGDKGGLVQHFNLFFGVELEGK